MALRVRAWVRWAFRLRAEWAVLLVPMLAVLGPAVAARCAGVAISDGLRWAGALLELAGLGIVIYNVLDLARRFKRGSYRERLRTWWRSRPGDQNVQMSIGAANLKLDGADVRLSVSRNADPSDFKARLDALEAELRDVKAEVDRTRTGLGQRIDAIESRLSSDVTRLHQKIESIASDLKDTATGSLEWELVGTAWLAAGVILAGFSSELPDCFRWVWRLLFGWAPWTLCGA